ncbi:TonB-dependent receptor [Mucilaginibacter terrenus]|uniref:TonB-dependent receptor n=1 Tax=Mucilaginibacter terrenus TaxID=2482727 RepID=A0A3E2NY04_9SPHI|nr:outer membrane beta-barrel family protein [Mucilaginibacter terrenus]RFZ85867.1 TonB-dependent receptor [Mucilaginibacter terrenus]
MRLFLYCLFLTLTLTVSANSYGQSPSANINGLIYLPKNVPAVGSTAVLLKAADSSIVMSALADGRGQYWFPAVSQGRYLVLASNVGYAKAYSNVFTVSTDNITADPVYLLPLSTSLKEVVVTAKRPLVEVRPGKTIINPQASITADGKNVLDIMAQSPGVRVDHNDNISISGRQSALVLIDGKTTNMTGTDLASLLRGMPGSNVERIELLSGSPKYDASAGGVINIVLKKGKNIGTNGTVNLSAGYGRYYKSAGGITFNNRTKNVNIFGSYGAIAEKRFKRFTNDRNINDNGTISSYNLDYNSIQEFVTHNFRLGADVSLSANHSIGAFVSGFVSNNNYTKDNHLDIANQGHLDSMIRVSSALDRDLRNINYNLNYSGKLDKAGKMLSAEFTYSPYKRSSDEYITNRFLNSLGAAYKDASLLQNLSPSNRHNYTGVLDYVNPFGKTAKLEAGVKYSHTKSDNNLIFGPQVEGVYTVDPNFSNSFIYKEDVDAAYLNYSNTWGKIDVSAGLRGEYTRSEGYSLGAALVSGLTTLRKYFNLFPNVLLHYTKDEKNEYTLSFNRGITRPDYESLNPFLYYIDPYNYQSGNPYLLPEYTNSIELGYLYDQNLGITAYANINTNAIFPYFYQNDATKVNLGTSLNLGQVNSYGLKVNAELKVTEWWKGNVNADGSYQRYRVYPENGTLDRGTGDLVLTTTQTFTLSKKISGELGGRYETPAFYGIRQFRANYAVNAAVGMQVFEKRGKLSLNVSDLFNTDRDRAYTNFQNLDLRFYDKRETRIVRLNFTYKFGKTTVKGASSHSTGNEDEQLRMRRSTN